jgi:serine/threonine-protein kinase
MSLSPGDRVGPYVVVARLGAGGMGEVYRARDTRLERTVALKILSPDLARDAQFRERFTREARAVAALNHPHICTVYDAGETAVDASSSRAVQFLAMEFLEGETLAARLSRGPLPVAEALPIAVQLARALAQAHRGGIVHRDLKPANVMLTKGSAKLLDFGLAKQTGIGTADLTTAGVVLGTLQYMAPEQLTGQPADARTDIFAFGAVLYEMLTGTRAVVGGPVAATQSAVTAPIASALGIQSPALDRTVRKCLSADPDERWQSAADLAAELQWIAGASSGSAAIAAGARPLRRAWVREAIAWGLVAVGVAAGVVLFQQKRAPALTITPKRFVVSLPDLRSIVAGTRPFALLPDGSGVVYLGGTASAWRVHVYTFADRAVRTVPDTDGAQLPAVSPDGKWIAFVASSGLMKVAVTGGGAPVKVCDMPSVRGLTWVGNDSLVFGADSGLQRVPAGGGEPETLTTLQPGESRHVAPHPLPGHGAVLFTVLRQTGAPEDTAIEAVSLVTRERTVLLTGGADGRYLRSGHLVYGRQSDVMAVGFDPESRQVSGTPFVAATGIHMRSYLRDAFFDVSADGTFIALPAGDLQRSLVWVDRQGLESSLPVPVRPYAHPSLLPDERSAVVELDDSPHNLWLIDLMTGALTRLTLEGANHRPVISPDGRFIAFSSDRTTPRNLFRQAIDGSGVAQRLTTAPFEQNVTAWSPDDQWLAFTQIEPKTREDLWVLPVDGSSPPRPLVRTGYGESAAVFSPDGRWIAYTSDESGRREVMIRAMAEGGPRKQLSTGGGETPSFSTDGKTVYYRLDDRVWAVRLSTEPGLSADRPSVAFKLTGVPPVTGLANYAISRTGQRVLAVRYARPEAHDLDVTVSWFESLRHASAGR